MAAVSAPRVRRLAQNTQYTYNLHRSIYDAKTYPVLSPQGATILIYGHENGLTIIWRGGRRLKSLGDTGTQSDAGDERNGAKPDDAVMVIDSDDDEAPAASEFVDNPQFEDAEAEDENGFPEVVQTLDLSLGTAVCHVAVLPITHCAPSEETWSGSETLKEKMAFAVTCATTNVYLITLPLTPPSHEAKARPELRADLTACDAGKGKWGETMVSLGGQLKPSEGVAMTLVKQKGPPERRKSAERSKSSFQPARVVVAAHSREARGTLRLWDVQLEASGKADQPVNAFQTEYLPSAPTSVVFNPTHSTQLLVTASPHAVRIYDFSIPSLPPDDLSEDPFPSKGSWLLSLYPPFPRGSSTLSRKPIIDSAWISHGRAILTLLADGQWGIWDIEGVAPGSTGLFGKSTSGIRGSGITSFSVTGYLEGTSPLRNPGSRTSASGTGGEFVPMTPHTRRETAMGVRNEALFCVRGGIEVVRLSPFSSSGSGRGDESAVLWMGGADPVVAVIPGIARFWEAQVKRGVGGGVNLFGGAQPSRMIRIAELGAGLLGERCSAASALVRSQSRQRTRSSGAEAENDQHPDHGLPIDVLVAGESRVTFVRESEEGPSTTKLFGIRKRKLGAAEPVSAIIVHQQPEDNRLGMPLSFGASTRNNTLRASRATRDAPPTQVTVETLFSKSPSKKPALLTQPTRSRMQAEHGPEPYPSAFDNEVTMTRSMMAHEEPPRPTSAGLEFADDLDRAADAEEGEFDPERNVEEELLDIMEIDRALEEMRDDRESGRKHVFFEEE